MTEDISVVFGPGPLGIRVGPSTDAERRAHRLHTYVSGVTPSGQGYNLGVCRGDLLVSLGGGRVTNVQHATVVRMIQGASRPLPVVFRRKKRADAADKPAGTASSSSSQSTTTSSSGGSRTPQRRDVSPGTSAAAAGDDKSKAAKKDDDDDDDDNDGSDDGSDSTVHLSDYEDANGISGLVQEKAVLKGKLKRTASGEIEVGTVIEATQQVKERLLSSLGGVLDSASPGVGDRLRTLKTGEAAQELSKAWREGSAQVGGAGGLVPDDIRQDLGTASTKLKKVAENEKVQQLSAEVRAELATLGESEEAKELIEETNDVVRDLKESAVGKQLVTAIGAFIETNADTIVATTESVATEGAWKLKQMDAAQPGLSLLSGDADADADAALSAKLRSALDRGKTELEKASQDEGTKELLDGAIAESKTLAARSTEVASVVADSTISLSSGGLKMLAVARENDVGKAVLRSGLDLVKSIKQTGGVDGAVENVKELLADPEKRRAFLERCKDSILEFMMQHLPKVQVPVVEGEKNGFKYTIDNIDLSQFSVPSRCVEINVELGQLQIQADYINFVIPNLQWEYQGQYFPYLSGAGEAMCTSFRTRFNIIFQLSHGAYSEVADDLNDTLKLSEEERAELKEKLAKDKPRLTMEEPAIVLDHLQLAISGSQFSWLYNLITTVFSSAVKYQIEANLVSTLMDKADALVEQLNSFGEAYWPYLLDVADKNIVRGKAAYAQTSNVAKRVAESKQGKEAIAVGKQVRAAVSTAATQVKDAIKTSKAAKDVQKAVSKVKASVDASEVGAAARLAKEVASDVGAAVRVKTGGKIAAFERRDEEFTLEVVSTGS